MKQNMQQAKQFLEALCAEADPIVFFQTFDDSSCNGDMKRRELVHQLFGRLSEFEDRLIALNNKGAGVYVTVNETDGKGRKTENVTKIRALFVDKDDGAFDGSFHVQPTIRIQTKNGEHAYWVLSEPMDLGAFRAAQTKLIEHYGTDKSIKDLPRVMRLPGFLHQKDPKSPFLVNIFEALGKRYRPEEILEDLWERASGGKEKEEEFVTEGGRHTYLFKFMGKLKGRGYEEIEIRNALYAENERVCRPPLDDSEVESIANSIKQRSVDEVILYSAHTDLGNADRFIAFAKGRVIYLVQKKKWLVYDGSRFVDDGKAGVLGEVRLMLRRGREIGENARDENGDSFTNHLKKTQSKARIEAMLELSTGALSCKQSELDADPFAMNLANGTLDLRSGKLRAHSASDLITKISPVKFDPNASCPKFLEFLDQITASSPELQRYLQMVVGYSMLGMRNEEQCFWLFYGNGDNGKSTLLELIKHVLGEYGTSTSTSTFALGKGNHARNDLARLVGARLVTAAETQEGSSLDESLVKQITGCDPVLCRFLFNEFFEYTPTWKIILAVNHLPEISGSDHGIWKRIKVVPFDVQIPKDKIDRQLYSKLTAELSGIFNWMLEGCLAWQKHGFIEPEIIKHRVQEYRTQEDVLDEFLQENTSVGAGYSVSARELYRRFATERKTLGQKVISSQTFGSKMKTKGFAKRRNGPNGRWEYVGLRFSSAI